MNNLEETAEKLACKYDMRIPFIMSDIENDDSLNIKEKLGVAFYIGKKTN